MYVVPKAHIAHHQTLISQKSLIILPFELWEWTLADNSTGLSNHSDQVIDLRYSNTNTAWVFQNSSIISLNEVFHHTTAALMMMMPTTMERFKESQYFTFFSFFLKIRHFITVFFIFQYLDSVKTFIGLCSDLYNLSPTNVYLNNSKWKKTQNCHKFKY